MHSKLAFVIMSTAMKSWTETTRAIPKELRAASNRCANSRNQHELKK